MDSIQPQTRQYLQKVCDMTGADTQTPVSMYEVGEAIGLDKAEAGALAEDLMVEGLLELQSLSGGISITPAGLRAIAAGGSSAGADQLKLGAGPYIGERERSAVEDIVSEIKAVLSSRSLSYDALEELVIDIKTMDVQLLSPKPKTEIVREILRSLGLRLGKSGADTMAAKIEAMTAA